MDHPTLRGCSILVVEDEAPIAMNIVTALEAAGANATTTTSVCHALILAEHDGLSAAVMDHALSDGDSTALCARLKERGIPYVSYGGHGPVEGASENSIYISKPVTMEVLVNALEGLLVGKPPRVS
jgi:DNA-binding response OmpR family regulator